MIWILTLILCAGLMTAVAALMHPALIEETIGKYWRSHTFYRRH